MPRVLFDGGALLVALALAGCSKANPAFDEKAAPGALDAAAESVGPGPAPGDAKPAPKDADATPDAPTDTRPASADAALSDGGRDVVASDMASDGPSLADSGGDARDASDAGAAGDLAGERPSDGGADLTVAELGTYVAADPSRGSDTNPGTKTAPVRSIARGLQNATTIMMAGGGPQTVFVAQGHYAEKVTLTEGISLLGGHECNATACTWSRNLAMFDTTLDAVDAEGLLAPATVSRKTRVEGLRVRGKDAVLAPSLGSAAITLAGGSPTITGNVIVGGNAGAGVGRSLAIEVLAPTSTKDPGGALIDGNTITAGAAAKEAVGIGFGGRPGLPAEAISVATVTNNAIRGGDAPSSFAILAWTSGPGTLVKGNQIVAGSGVGGAGTSWAITVGSIMTIDANRINLDQAAVGSCEQANIWCGGIQSLSATSTITNNIVLGTKGPRTAGLFLQEAERPGGAAVVNANTFDGGGGSMGAAGSVSAAIALRIGICDGCGFGGFTGKVRNNILLGGANQLRYGVYEDSVPQRTLHPEVLDNNDFHFNVLPGRQDVLYRVWNGSTATDVTTVPQLASVPVRSGPPKDNLRVDPAFDQTMHLTRSPPSPCIDKGTANEAPSRDFDGDARPLGAAVDIGHDEAQ